MTFTPLKYLNPSGPPITVVDGLRNMAERWLTPDEADYTGTIDASAAIQAAVDESALSGQVLRLLPGVLRTDSLIEVRSRLHVVGAGIGKTIIMPTSAAAFGGGGNQSTPLEDVTFAHLEIDGINQGTPFDVARKGFYFRNVRRVNIDSCLVRNTGATGYGIDHITGTITNCWAINCGRLGLATSLGSSGFGIGVGALDAGWEPLTISNCHAEGNKRYGIFLETQTVAKPAGLSVIGCTARGNKDGFGDCGTTGARWIGCSAEGNSQGGFTIDPGTKKARGSNSTLIMGGHSRGNLYGVHVFADKDTDLINWVSVQGNHIAGNASHGINVEILSPAVTQGITVAGNTIVNNGGKGLRVFGTATYVSPTIRDNRLAGNTAASSIESATTGLILTGNDFRNEGATVTVTPTTPGSTAGNYGTVTVA